MNKVPETVEADEVGETGDPGVQGCVHHVELEEWEPSAKFQQRSCAIRCVLWRSHSGPGWVESESGWAGLEDIVQLATCRLSPMPFPGYLVRPRAPESPDIPHVASKHPLTPLPGPCHHVNHS